PELKAYTKRFDEPRVLSILQPIPRFHRSQSGAWPRDPPPDANPDTAPPPRSPTSGDAYAPAGHKLLRARRVSSGSRAPRFEPTNHRPARFPRGAERL